MKKKISALVFLFCCFFIAAQAQNAITIKGIVFDGSEETLPGATVFLKDRPSYGTSTDGNGRFEIKASLGDSLIVSMVGFDKFRFFVTKAESNLKVVLKPSSGSMLNEAVVTGVGATTRKVSIVGAITTVELSQIKIPATSIPNMLGGRVAGIIAVQASGEPGKDISSFWIRGIGTFGANAAALVLIDGLEGSLNNLDPDDVESFSILKDASATAVYGVRGANGVVLITTKRGNSEKPDITARYNVQTQILQNMPTYLGAADYAALANEANVVRGNLPIYTPTDMTIIKNNLDPDLFPDVNWRDVLMKNSSMTNTYYVSARGGSSLSKYFLSLGVNNHASAYTKAPDSKYNSNVSYNTYSYRANIDMDLTKTTKLSFGVDGSITDKTNPGGVDTDYLWALQGLLTPLTIPVKYSGGQLPGLGAAGGGMPYSPFVALNYTGTAKTLSYNNTISVTLNQDMKAILKGLTWRGQMSIAENTGFYETRYLMPELYYASGRKENGELFLQKKSDRISTQYNAGQSQSRKLNFETTLNYSTIVNVDHRFSGLLYYSMNDSKAAGANSSMNAISNRYQGISSRVSYGYKDTYFVDLNCGYTGSENFKPGSQFGFFPAIAAGWIPTNYQLVTETLPWLNYLKLRGSYGSVGNDKISNSTRFPYLTTYNENSAPGWGGPNGISVNSEGADNLAWERATKVDVGIDGKILNHSVDFTVDIFRDTRDGIYQQRVQIPSYVGLSNMPYGNVGSMVSSGSDGSASFSQKISDKMSFTLRGNFTYSKNDVLNWEQASQPYPYLEYAGWPNGVQRGYQALGLFRDAQDVANSPNQTFGQYMAGDIKYKDVNGDGQINSDDKVPLAYPNFPSLMYGFGGELSYKNLTFGIMFKGTGKTTFFYTSNGGGAGYIPFINGKLGNVLDICNVQSNRWTPASYSGTTATENPNARFPRLSYDNNQNNSQLSTFWRGNSQYLRLSELSLGYKLRNDFLRRMKINSLTMNLVASNIYVWDSVKMWDPEQASRNGQAYPIPANLTLTVYVNI